MSPSPRKPPTIARDRKNKRNNKNHEKIIANHNSLVEPNDYVYVLGDLCLGGSSSENLRQCKKMIENMKGRLKIVLGNHDSATRVEMFAECWNVDAILGYADMIKYNKYHY